MKGEIPPTPLYERGAFGGYYSEGETIMAKARPLRTSMYVPGNKEDWMRKAPQYGADALILDLEDSVPVPNKAEARALVRKMLEELGGEKPTLTVRVNRLETGLTGSDLEAITCPQLYGVLLPKVESPADVVEVDNLLSYFERKAGMEVGSIFIDPGLETAQSIRQSYEIATASSRIAHMGGSGRQGRWYVPFHQVPVDSRRAGNSVPQVQGID